MAKKKNRKPDLRPRLMKDGKEVKMASALEKIQKLQEQIEEAKAAALEELREKRREAQAAVNDIDKEIAALTGTGKTGIKRQRDLSKPCPVCGETGHDARRHRGDKKARK